MPKDTIENTVKETLLNWVDNANRDTEAALKTALIDAHSGLKIKGNQGIGETEQALKDRLSVVIESASFELMERHKGDQAILNFGRLGQNWQGLIGKGSLSLEESTALSAALSTQRVISDLLKENTPLPEYLQEMDQLLEQQIIRFNQKKGVHLKLSLDWDYFESVRRETADIQKTFLHSRHFLDDDNLLIQRQRVSLEKTIVTVKKLPNAEKMPCLFATDALTKCLDQLEAPIFCMNNFKQEMLIYFADIRMAITEDETLSLHQEKQLRVLLDRVSSAISHLTNVSHISGVIKSLDVVLKCATEEMAVLFPDASHKTLKPKGTDLFKQENKNAATLDGKKIVADLKKIVEKLPQDLMNENNELEQRGALLERPVDADSFKNRSDSLSSYTSSEASTEASSEKRLSDNDFHA